MDDIVHVNEEEKAFSRLEKLGITTHEQLLLHLPKGYLDCSKTYDVVEELFGEAEARIYKVTVTSKPDLKGLKPPRLEFWTKDRAENLVKVTVFGLVEPWKHLSVGGVVFIRGVAGTWTNKFTRVTEVVINSPELIDPDDIGKVVPLYRGKTGVISVEYITRQVRQFLPKINSTVDYLHRYFEGTDEHEILKRSKVTAFKSMAEFVYALHHPKDLQQGVDALDAARKIAAFEVVWASQKRSMARPDPKSVIRIDDRILNSMASRLGFSFTGDQKKAIHDISEGLKRPYPLNMLLSGDVGTGKTAVFGVCAAAARAVNAHVAILMPNLLLVRQTEEKMRLWYPKMNLVSVVSGSSQPDFTQNPVVIGTTAMFSRIKKAKWHVDFLIVDEQNKFSVTQREELRAEHTNILEATATCVPRTAALVMNSGMDLTILQEKPFKNRIVSRIVTYPERKKLFDHIGKVMDNGGQVAIIYPNVKVTDKNIEAKTKADSENKKYYGANAKSSAEDAFKSWDKMFPGKVCLVHGKMSDEDKLRLVDDMKAGKYQACVSTVLIEAGVDIEKLMSIVVVNAGRFGVSQLHQIRGRVARHGGTGYFFMYEPNDIDQSTMERLEMLETESNGFKLADMDMELRGFGDVAEDGTKQSGNVKSSVFTNIKIRPSDLREILSDIK